MNLTMSSDRPQLPKCIKMYKKVAKKYMLQFVDHYSNWKQFLKSKGRGEYIKVVSNGVHPNLDWYGLILRPELKNYLINKL